MQQPFHIILSSWLRESGLSRNEAIAKLQLFEHSEFKGLDTITLSRWVNGKTIPPLAKQILIAVCLNKNVATFIAASDLSFIKLPARLTKIMSKFEKVFDFVNPTLSYKNLHHEKCNIVKLNNKEFSDTFKTFYENIKFPISIFEILEKNDITPEYSTVLLTDNNNHVIAHWPLFVNLNFFPGISEKELKDAIFLGTGFFHTTKQYYEIVTYVSCLFLMNTQLLNSKRFAYILIYGYATYEVAKIAFGATEVMLYPRDNSRAEMYMLKIDILKAITNPLIIKKTQSKLKCALSCTKEKCNKCNLVEYYKQNNIQRSF